MSAASETKAPWNPSHIVILALVTTPLVAGVVHALNFGRLGRPERGPAEMAKNVGASSLLVLTLWQGALAPQLVGALSLALAGYYGLTQKESFLRHRADGGQVSSFVRPAAWSTIAMVGGAFAVLAFLVAADIKTLVALEELYDAERFVEFEAQALDYLEADPGQASVRWDLINLYVGSDRLPEAEDQLTEYVRLHPDDARGTVFLERIRRTTARADTAPRTAR